MNKDVSARVNLSEYTNRVLGIIKIKYGLQTKSEALNKFIEIYGEDVLDKEPKEDYIKRIVEISNKHLKKHGFKKMSIEELDKICGV